MIPCDLSPGQLAQIACILEVTARKPGNVHRFADFHDTSYLDFVLSASAIAGPLDRAGTEGIGATVLAAVQATRRVVATNTNLGMILLLAPLAAVPLQDELRSGIVPVLDRLSVEDARFVYQAIRLAQPGGLGKADRQDVADEPTVTLRDAMRIAAGRDRIAWQYANDFSDIFDLAAPVLRRAIQHGASLEKAILLAYLTLLSQHPDSLIARKLGPDAAAEVTKRTGAVLTSGLVDPDDPVVRAFDAWLRHDGHARNPGTTADLIAAALYVLLRDGTIKVPFSPLVLRQSASDGPLTNPLTED